MTTDETMDFVINKYSKLSKQEKIDWVRLHVIKKEHQDEIIEYIYKNENIQSVADPVVGRDFEV